MSRSAHLWESGSPGIGRRWHAFLIVNPGSGDGGPDELLAAARGARDRDAVLATATTSPALARDADADALGDGGRRRLARARSRRWRSSGACRSCASRSGPATTSRATSGSTATTRSRALDAFVDGRGARDRRRPRERPPVPEQRLARRLRATRPPARSITAGAATRSRGCARSRSSLTQRHAIGLTVDGEPIEARVVLVANNAYEPRRALDRRAQAARRRTALSLCAARACCRSNWEERAGERFTVDARAGRLRAAVDGEPDELETPIEFRDRARARYACSSRARPGG